MLLRCIHKMKRLLPISSKNTSGKGCEPVAVEVEILQFGEPIENSVGERSDLISADIEHL